MFHINIISHFNTIYVEIKVHISKLLTTGIDIIDYR